MIHPAPRKLRIGSFLALWLIAGAGPALAQEQAATAPVRIARMPARPALAPGMSGTHTAVFECEGNRGLFQVAVHPSRMTTFYFASPVLDAVNPAPRRLAIAKDTAKITVQPRRTEKEYLGNLAVSSRACDVNIDLWLAKRAEDAPVTVDIRQRDQVAEELARMRAAHDLRMRALERKEHALARQETRFARKEQGLRDALAAELLLHDKPLMPLIRKTARASDDLDVHVGAGQWLGDDFFFPYKLINHGAQPYSVTDIRIVDAAGTRIQAEVLRKDASPESPEQGPFAEIAPRQRVDGVIKLPRAASRSIAPLTIQIVTRNGLQPLLARLIKWYPAEYEQDYEEEQEKDRVTLHLVGVGGAIWLQEDVEQGSESRFDATSMTGLGARVTYGFNRTLGLEAEVIGGSTGEARFDEASFDGMQGELVRSASLGIVRVGGVVRLGRRIVPTVRAGLGVQGASIDARFLVDGSEAPGPDSSFALSGLWYFGGGVDFKLGDHFIAGAGISFSPRDMSMRAIEGGIHLGYGWKP